MRTIWQDILALDSQYNNLRFFSSSVNCREPSLLAQSNLYLRRRSHLLSEQINPIHSQGGPERPSREDYLRWRKNIFLARYGSAGTGVVSAARSISESYSSPPSYCMEPSMSSTSRSSLTSGGSLFSPVPTLEAFASRSLTGDTSISENYAFAGIKHIFDHHKASVNRIRFAHNDASRLALASSDATVSICRTWPTQQEQLLALLRGHHLSVVDLAWSNNNDYILSCSLDSTVCLWNVELVSLARVYSANELGVGEALCCEFQPLNNNLFVVGGSRGYLQVVNSSTGKVVKGGRDKMGGAILSVTFETSLGECLWAGNSQSIIQSYRCDIRSGRLTRGRRLTVATQPSPVCSLNYRAWLSREARDPCLLVNAGLNYLLFYRVVSKDGQLLLKSRFPIQHKTERIRSCFCPLISFRQGACVVTGSEDTHVYVYDVTITSLGDSKCITLLQGHSAAVTDVAISYDENVMASCDKAGVVILWKRIQEDKE